MKEESDFICDSVVRIIVAAGLNFMCNVNYLFAFVLEFTYGRMPSVCENA